MVARHGQGGGQRRNGSNGSGPSVAHRASVAQPHTAAEGPVADAEVVAARMSTSKHALGQPGEPVNRRSPFFIGMSATAGVAMMVGVVGMVVTARDVLLLIGLALFLAIGLEPVVSLMVRHAFPRWTAVLTVLLAGVAMLGGFLAAAIPPLVRQATQFLAHAPAMMARLQARNSFVGQLNDHFQLRQRLQQTLSGDASGLFSGLLGAGQVVFGALASGLIVAVLTVYFVSDLPRIRATLYRLVPASRRPRAILLGDEIFAKVGGYVLGSLLLSLIAGVVTFTFLVIVGAPYPLLLSIFVMILDVVPVIGSSVAGLVVSLVALTVSLPVCLATVGYFVLYRLAEDYLLVPRVIGRAVEVPALVTVVAVLVGGALLGVVGAVVAIPAAAAVLLLVREIVVPRLDHA